MHIVMSSLEKNPLRKENLILLIDFLNDIAALLHTLYILGSNLKNFK